MNKEIVVTSEKLRETANRIEEIHSGVVEANKKTTVGIENVVSNWLDENGKKYQQRYNEELAPHLKALEDDINAMKEILLQTASDYDRLNEEDANAVGL